MDWNVFLQVDIPHLKAIMEGMGLLIKGFNKGPMGSLKGSMGSPRGNLEGLLSLNMECNSLATKVVASNMEEPSNLEDLSSTVGSQAIRADLKANQWDIRGTILDIEEETKRQ